jgi:hypothetical protein
MITGFNTDIRCGDKVFHVQTEDKGIKNPIIISLIYQKGLILDSYRTPYAVLLPSERFNEALLRRILEFQHRQLLLALKNGTYQKGMRLADFVEGDFVFVFPIPPEVQQHDSKTIAGAPTQFTETPALRTTEFNDVRHETGTPVVENKNLNENTSPEENLLIILPPLPVEPGVESNSTLALPLRASTANHQESLPPVTTAPAHGEFSPIAGRSRSGIEKRPTPSFPVIDINEAVRLNKIRGIEICLESSRDFIAGHPTEISLYIQGRSTDIRLENVQVLLKVIGTNLSPRIYSGKTDKLGTLKISFTLPEYKLGSAALIIQASSQIGGDQVKYLIKRK